MCLLDVDSLAAHPERDPFTRFNALTPTEKRLLRYTNAIKVWDELGTEKQFLEFERTVKVGDLVTLNAFLQL